MANISAATEHEESGKKNPQKLSLMETSSSWRKNSQPSGMTQKTRRVDGAEETDQKRQKKKKQQMFSLIYSNVYTYT